MNVWRSPACQQETRTLFKQSQSFVFPLPIKDQRSYLDSSRYIHGHAAKSWSVPNDERSRRTHGRHGNQPGRAGPHTHRHRPAGHVDDRVSIYQYTTTGFQWKVWCRRFITKPVIRRDVTPVSSRHFTIRGRIRQEVEEVEKIRLLFCASLWFK